MNPVAKLRLEQGLQNIQCFLLTLGNYIYCNLFLGFVTPPWSIRDSCYSCVLHGISAPLWEWSQPPSIMTNQSGLFRSLWCACRALESRQSGNTGRQTPHPHPHPTHDRSPTPTHTHIANSYAKKLENLERLRIFLVL